MRQSAIAALAFAVLCHGCSNAPTRSTTSSAPPLTPGASSALDVRVGGATTRFGLSRLITPARVLGFRLSIIAHRIRADCPIEGAPTLRKVIEKLARHQDLNVTWAGDGTGAVVWRTAPAGKVDAIRRGLRSSDPKAVRSAIWDGADSQDLDAFTAAFEIARTDDDAALELFAAFHGLRFEAVVTLDRALAERLLTVAFDRAGPHMRGVAIRRARDDFPEMARTFIERGLSDTHVSLRQTAASLIEYLDARAQKGAIEKALGDADEQVRASAVQCLARCSFPLDDRIRIATKALDDTSNTRRSALGALSRLDPGAHYAFVMKALREDDGAWFGSNYYIDHYQFTRPQMLDLIEAVLEHGDGRMRQNVSMWAAGAGGPEGVAVLEKALASDDPALASAAAGQAVQLEYADARALVEKVLADERPRVRQKLLSNANRIEDEVLYRRVLVPMLEDVDTSSVHALATALARLRTPEADAHLAALLSDPDTRLRGNTVRALSRPEASEAVAKLEEATRDPNASVRTNALSALAQIRGPKAFGVLAEMLGSEDANVRSDVARSLSPWHNDRHSELLERLAADQAENVRAAVAGKLGHRGKTGRSMRLLRKLAADSSPTVRSSALRVLGRLGEGEPLALVEKALADPDQNVRRTAAGSLCQGAWSKRRKELVKRMLAHDDIDIRRGVLQSLSYYGGRSLRTVLLEYLPREDSEEVLKSAKRTIERRYDPDPEIRAAIEKAMNRGKDSTPKRAKPGGLEVF